MARIKDARMSSQPIDGLSLIAEFGLDAIAAHPLWDDQLRAMILITDGHKVGNAMANFPDAQIVLRFLELNVEAFRKFIAENN